MKWLFAAEGPGDTAFLGVMFALNAGFASVDSFTRGFMESMRDDFRRLVARYRDPEWIASVEKDVSGDNAGALGKKDRLGAAVDEALELESGIPLLFKRSAKIWKSVMGVCAAVLLVCMAVPYSGRVLLLLALPVPLFAWRCLIERNSFNKVAAEACRKIDENYERIKGALASAPDKEEASVKARLDRIENMLNGIVAQGAPKAKPRAAKAKPRGLTKKA